MTYRNTFYFIGSPLFFKIIPALLRKCPGQIPLNENFEFLKIMIFNFILFWKIWNYIKGGLNYKTMRAHFSIADPFDMYLKKLRKYFQIFHTKIKSKIIILKTQNFHLRGICPGHFRRSHSFKVVLDP